MEPESYGFKRAEPKEIEGGNAKRNAEIVRGILDGEKGPKREMVLLNAASAYVASGLDSGFNAEGIKRAESVIDSGKRPGESWMPWWISPAGAPTLSERNSRCTPNWQRS